MHEINTWNCYSLNQTVWLIKVYSTVMRYNTVQVELTWRHNHIYQQNGKCHERLSISGAIMHARTRGLGGRSPAPQLAGVHLSIKEKKNHNNLIEGNAFLCRVGGDLLTIFSVTGHAESAAASPKRFTSPSKKCPLPPQIGPPLWKSWLRAYILLHLWSILEEVQASIVWCLASLALLAAVNMKPPLTSGNLKPPVNNGCWLCAWRDEDLSSVSTWLLPEQTSPHQLVSTCLG